MLGLTECYQACPARLGWWLMGCRQLLQGCKCLCSLVSLMDLCCSRLCSQHMQQLL